MEGMKLPANPRGGKRGPIPRFTDKQISDAKQARLDGFSWAQIAAGLKCSARHARTLVEGKS